MISRLFIVEPRSDTPRWLAALVSLQALALTALFGFLLFWLLGYDPWRSLYYFFLAPLIGIYSLGELCLKAGPLIMIATGLALGFRAGVWNIGAEGQLIIGALAGGSVGLLFWHHAGYWILPLMLVAASAGGMAYAAIPAFLRTRFGANEILTSLMLTYVAVLLLSAAVTGPLRDPDGLNFPQSRLFTAWQTLPILLPGSRLHIGFILALLSAVAGWLILNRSVFGFALRIQGQAPAATLYAGFSAPHLIWLALLTSGALAGLAGGIEITGPIGQLIPQISPGYGFTAIIVAFLGRLHPLGIIAAGLLVALSYIGSETAQIAVGLPRAVGGVFQGVLLFTLLAGDFFCRYRLRRLQPAPSRQP